MSIVDPSTKNDRQLTGTTTGVSSSVIPSSIALESSSLLATNFDKRPRTSRKEQIEFLDSVYQGVDRPIISPRTAYLEGCLDHHVNPRPSLILRKELSTELNLSHHAMGDAVAKVFALSLKEMPSVRSLNLSDNNLTDEGVSAILLAVVDMKYLASLDLSMNKIDGNAADALAHYLKTPRCPIIKLVLQSADIDDVECDKFITAIRYEI